MLKGVATRHVFWGLYVTLMALQVMLAMHTSLFGDEAFYWLESLFIQWSYGEIPGFVPWLNALSTAVLPQHPFFLRLPYLLVCWSLPWLSYGLVKHLSQCQQAAWQAALLTLLVPLIGLIGVLAIADIWLIFFTLLALFFLLRLMQSPKRIDAVYLGITLMLAVNVHIRFWFVLFVAFIAATVIYQQYFWKQKVLWQFTLPLVFLGFVPILIFNVQHDFTLLGFQLGERNPWQFQPSHLWFFLGQFIITTPLVFGLCLISLKRPVDDDATKRKALLFIQLLAVLYWLLYAILGFFSDNLRTNIHWPIPAYLLLLLVAATYYQRHVPLKKWAVVTGGFAHVLFLIGFYLLLHNIPVTSNNHKQLINNAIGWQQVTAKTRELQQPGQVIIGDYFMTAAVLNYQRNEQTLIAALPHPMNQKHGRRQQLALMNLLYQDTPEKPALLVVEHTALKLHQQIPFYQNSCRQLNGLRLIDDLSIRQGSKIYYFFYTNAHSCDIPPIIYHDYQQGIHSGWVMVSKDINTQLNHVTITGKSTPVSSVQSLPLGQDHLFSTVNAAHYQRLGYQVEANDHLQLSVQTADKTITTQRFYR
ncbi:MAG: phospholipid carrier-dependent glycosyltransferase [Proteobacteria bacterium]|nr:MAG: phospholipid carrier-dependent glycosyltransferase [Pseudomonadota bacterium]